MISCFGSGCSWWLLTALRLVGGFFFVSLLCACLRWPTTTFADVLNGATMGVTHAHIARCPTPKATYNHAEALWTVDATAAGGARPLVTADEYDFLNSY
jgi:hypothetical protein